MDKQYDIKDIIEKRVDDPVAVWGSEDLLCRDLYNALWEEHCWKDDFFHVDREILQNELSPLCRYLAAILYERWSRQADVDIEDELQEKIDLAFAECDLSNATFNPYRPWFRDHNEDNFIFGNDDNLSKWLGECLGTVASYLSGVSPSRHVNEDKFIWMMNERPENPRPCFKASGWDSVVADILGEISLMWAGVANGIEVVMFERKDFEGISWGDEISWTPINSIEHLENKFYSGMLSKKNTVALSVDSDEYAGIAGEEIIVFLDALSLIPDDVKYFVVFGYEQKSEMNANRMKDIVSRVGLSVLAAPSDEKNVLGATLHGKVKTEYGMRSSLVYSGDVSGKVSKTIDSVLSYHEALCVLENMLEKDPKDSSYNVLDELESLNSTRGKLIKRNLVEAIKRLSFGQIDMTDIDIEMNSGNRTPFDKRSATIVNISSDLSNAGRTDVRTPVLDMLKVLHHRYKEEKIFYVSEELVNATFHDRKEDESKYSKSTLDEAFLARCDECAASGEQAGIQYAIDAVRDGVPVEDVLA